MNALKRFVHSRRVYLTISVLVLVSSSCRGPQIARRLAGADDDFATTRTFDRLPDTTPPDSRRANARVAAASRKNPVQQAQLLVPLDDASTASDAQLPVAEPAEPPLPDALPGPLPPETSEDFGQEPYPIDLSTALALAGANNLQIAFAAERVREAAARVDRADVLWVPSLHAGLVYNNHAGRLQETEGNVIEVSRNSLFVGAGAVSGFSATTGGAGGPARMVVDLPLVDVLFEPLAARQIVRAAQAEQNATFNNTLLQVTSAYLDLLQAQSRVAIAREIVQHAEELARITADFARAGEGLEADSQRARAELNDRRRDLPRAKESVAVASAELGRLLRLDSAVTLVSTDSQVGPLEVVESDVPLRDLIGQALAARPEAARQDAFVDETWLRLRQEQWRPWMPHLYAGFSGGGFGGGTGSAVRSFSDRTDFDAAAVWEVQNLGFGNSARQRQQESAHWQAHITAEQFRDRIASEVSQSYFQVQYRREQIDIARRQVTAASQALSLNFDGIRGKAVRPIEAQQAIAALATARQQYLSTIIDFNRAQFELLRALGLPPGLTEQSASVP